MNLELTASMSFESMHAALVKQFPQYKIELKKNPILGFRYIQVYKSAFVGTWIRVFEKNNKVQLINTIPSTFARAFFGGLIAILFAMSAQNKLRKEVGEFLIREFSTKTLS
jgi:ABC-type phosphate/phosphonate transport system permease subunit